MNSRKQQQTGRSRLETVNIYQGRPDGATEWDLPTWGHPLSLGVFPLLAIKDMPHAPSVVPIGTAFCVSGIGLLVSALHNVKEALKHHWHGGILLQREQLPEDYELNDMGLTVFLHSAEGENKFNGTLWPLKGVYGAQPTDVIYGVAKPQEHFQYLSLPISFEVPMVGSKITCIGYSDASFPPEGISIDALRMGDMRWDDVYNHNFRVVEGHVTRIFTKRFAGGFIGGPCITIDVEVPHGMSGGPAFNEQGHVCGVVSAGATQFFNHPASIVSLLYPTFLTEIKFGMSMGPVQINSVRPISDLVAQGDIRTDGSETLVHITPDGADFEIGPMIRKENSAFVHDDFAGYQKGQEASREDRAVYQMRPQIIKEPKDNSG